MPRRNTRSTAIQPKIEPKASRAVARKPKMKAKATITSRTAPEQALTPSPSMTTPKAPSGKLGLLIEQVARACGASVEELADATGWQAHTIRAAFSRLRQRGFPIALVADPDGRKAYRLDPKEG